MPPVILRFKSRRLCFAMSVSAISVAYGCATSARISRASFQRAVRNPAPRSPSASRRHFPFRARPSSRPRQTGHFRLDGRGLSRRLGIIFTGDLERLREILDIEPRLGAEPFLNAILPQARALDIELALLLLIACLDAVAGHGPLPAYPEDIAMQGHGSRFRTRRSPQAEREDTAMNRLRNTEGRHLGQIAPGLPIGGDRL